MASRRTVETRIEGLRPLLKRLKRLPDRAQRHVLRPAVTKAATPVVKGARRLAPVGAGLTPTGRERPHLAQTITKTRAKWYPKSGAVLVVIGPEKNKAPHSHLVHDGTPPHEIPITKSFQLGNTFIPAGFVIEHPGAKANPFLASAIDAARPQSEAILRREIGRGIEKQTQILAKQS